MRKDLATFATISLNPAEFHICMIKVKEIMEELDRKSHRVEIKIERAEDLGEIKGSARLPSSSKKVALVIDVT